jgi:hypothetical protein
MNAIIDKIRHLQSLAKSSNINEATAAAAAADKLISKYRISEVEISIANKIADLPAVEDKEILYESGRVTLWKKHLAKVLANHYGCYMWNDWTKNNDRKVSRYRLVGVKNDIEITRYMFAWLLTEIERLSKSHCAGMGHVYANSYCIGAVVGIEKQLEKIKQDERAATNSEQTITALACLDERVDRAKETLFSLHKNLVNVKTHSYSRYNEGAYALGVNVGKSIHLGKVMGDGSGSNKMLK